MAFEVDVFAAEYALGLVVTDQLPALAQDAMEVGFDGPAVVRVAITLPRDQFELQWLVPKMLAELQAPSFTDAEAALFLARRRAEKILRGEEEAVASLGYFEKLNYAGEYPDALSELGWYLECSFLDATDEDEIRQLSRELLDPPLQEERRRKIREIQQEQTRKYHEHLLEKNTDWPYRFHSPKMWEMLRRRMLTEFGFLRVLVPAAILIVSLGLIRNKKLELIGIVTGLFLVGIPLNFVVQYRYLKRKRRDILFRQRYPEELI